MEIPIEAAAARQMSPIGSVSSVIVRAGITRAKYTPNPVRTTRAATCSGPDFVCMGITLFWKRIVV
jgi:hypothetical protein